MWAKGSEVKWRKLNVLETGCISFIGHPLQYKQSDIGIKGWAVESRVYAEV